MPIDLFSLFFFFFFLLLPFPTLPNLVVAFFPPHPGVSVIPEGSGEGREGGREEGGVFFFVRLVGWLVGRSVSRFGWWGSREKRDGRRKGTSMILLLRCKRGIQSAGIVNHL